MDKEDSVCTHTHKHNGTLLSHEKERNLAIGTRWMDLEGIMLSEISQRKTNTAKYPLYLKQKQNKLIEAEKRKVVARGWWWANRW